MKAKEKTTSIRIPEDHITMSEAATILSCSRQYIHQLLQAGKLRGKLVLGRWAVSKAAVYALRK